MTGLSPEVENTFQFVVEIKSLGKPQKALYDSAQFLLRCLVVSIPGAKVYYGGALCRWDSDKKEVVIGG